MRTILSFAALLALGLAIPTTDQDGWAAYKAKFGKVYSDPKEDLRRKEIYLHSKALVDKHNTEYAAGLSKFEMALNRFSDWTEPEIEAKSKGLRLLQERPKAEIHEMSGKSVPLSVDWREKNVVTPVKDQGDCGSCYAFSATGCLEGQLAIKNKKLVSLSEQEIVDCPFDGCLGCRGGDPQAIFIDLTNKVLQDPKGLESEANYPYTGMPGICQYNKTEIAGSDSGLKQISPSEKALKDAVANVGPISVGIYADGLSFLFYDSGIFDDPDCSSTQPPDHGVLVVGYGGEKGQEYWIVKNSWGKGWGENGYIRIAIGSNLCGIANYASYPTV